VANGLWPLAFGLWEPLAFPFTEVQIKEWFVTSKT